jgi:hypothetical protein
VQVIFSPWAFDWGPRSPRTIARRRQKESCRSGFGQFKRTVNFGHFSFRGHENASGLVSWAV